jgi:hypothetical protein
VGYKPGPEIYNNLYRIRKAPPLITQTLPDACPISNAQSRILSRSTTEDEFQRNYYTVLVTATDDARAGQEEKVHLDCSRILDYVSRKELSRFEGAEARAESEAVAAAQQAEAEEAARKILEKNARATGTSRGRGRGSRMLSGLGLPEARTRGRPRGRARGRVARTLDRRASLAQQGGNEMLDDRLSEDVMDIEPLEAAGLDDEDLQRIIAETSEDDDDMPVDAPSPNLARSSLIANSALATSLTAGTSRLLANSLFSRYAVPDANEGTDEEMEDDLMSASSAAAQLHYEGDERERASVSDESDRDRHRTKRRRTESTLTSRPPAPATNSEQLSIARNLSTKLLVAPAEPSSEHLQSEESDDPIGEEQTIRVRRPSPARSTNGISSQPDHAQPTNQVTIPSEEDDDDDDGDEDSEQSDAEEYVIEAILEHSYIDDTKYYLVKWQGYEESSDWLTAEDLAGAPEMIAEYEERIRRKKGKGKLKAR